MEFDIKIIEGTYIKYAEVKSPSGYYMYDKTLEGFNPIKGLYTAIEDIEEVKSRYAFISEKDAEELAKQRSETEYNEIFE